MGALVVAIPAILPDSGMSVASVAGVGDNGSVADDAQSVPARQVVGRYLGDQTGRLLLVGIASLIAGFIEAAILVLVVEMGLAITGGNDVVDFEAFPFVTATGVAVSSVFIVVGVLIVVRFAAQLVVSRQAGALLASIEMRVRGDLFDSYTRAAASRQAAEPPGALQDLLTFQTRQASQSLHHLLSAIDATGILTALMISAFLVQPVAAAAVMAFGVMLFFLMRPFARLSRRLGGEASDANARFAGGISETVALSREARTFNVDDVSRSRVGELLHAAIDPMRRQESLGRLAPAVYQTLGLALVIAALAGLRLLDSESQAGLGAVVLIIIRSLAYSQLLQANYHQLNELVPYIGRVLEAEENLGRHAATFGSESIESVRNVAFQSVTFSYDGETDVLDNIEFSVDAGEAIGIVGPSGVGKSTLADLLLRLQVATSGKVSINGVEVNRIDPDVFARRVAYVPQDPHLLRASVTENIRFHRPWITDEQVRLAAVRAAIDDTIRGWDDGYATAVADNSVSGGQRQRLSLARAFAGDPEVLVLDEPTAALDAETERAIRDTLASVKGEMTLFIVAHRPATLEICDRVLVLDHDGMVAIGPRDELLARVGVDRFFHGGAA